MLNPEQQEDINNIYADLLVLSTELDSIKKCLNNMAMALRPMISRAPISYPWEDSPPNKTAVRNGIRKEKVKRTNDSEPQDLPWDA